MLQLQPGVALDAWGHEIVVPEPVRFNPRQLTDEKGRTLGQPLDDGEVEICLAYTEKSADLVPVLVADCDAPGHCAASTVREGFHVVVRKSTDPPNTHECKLGKFPLPANEALHALLCKVINAEYKAPPKDPCAILAQVNLSKGASTVDPSAARQLVYSNPLLEQLIVCLADRFATGLNLRYVSGDGQKGVAGAELQDFLVVELLDATNKTVTGQTVQFQVTGGGGNFSGSQTVTTTTDVDGTARVTWRLGAPGAAQVATASAVGSIFSVEFHASVI